MVWDFIYARRLLSNGTYRPIHDAVLGFEHCMVAKARRILDAPPRYLAQVKTDCLLTQRLPKRFAERLRALEALRHPDGTPVYRVEETKPLLGSRAPRMEAERPKQRRWNGVDDPISHCLAGNSLLLTGLPGTGKTHLARTIVARLREQGEAVHLVSKTHCSAQNLGLGAQTADHWVRRNVRGGSAQKLDWLVVEEITQLDMALWADLACVGLNADVKFLLLGDFRQLPAVLDSWAGRPISAPLEHSQLIRDLAGGHRHELTENMRSDPGIFNFVKWLRVGEEACPTLEQAKARLKELFPSKPGWPDTTLVISHSKRMAVNAAANRALAPEGSKLLELDVIHIDLGCHKTVPQVPHGFCQTATTQNSPQSMRVWPGLRLIGAGGKIPKGVFVEPDGVRLDNGMRLKNQELLRATRPSHAVTYASCQGLTLHNRVRLDLECLAGHELRAAGSLERAARRLQGLQHEVAHLEEHAPLPGHQPHVPGLHKRAAPAARELRGARHAVAGGVPEEAALQAHLALHVLALGAHLPCGSCAHEVRCRLRAVCSAAQTARDGGRALPVVRQRVGLRVSCKVVLAEAVSSSHPRKAHCGSAEAFLGNCLQGRVLQGPGWGPRWTAQNRPGRSGL